MHSLLEEVCCQRTEESDDAQELQEDNATAVIRKLNVLASSLNGWKVASFRVHAKLLVLSANVGL